MITPPKTSQDFVPIEEIRDGTVVLKGGMLRAVLLASSVNFALKSEDEQLALLNQFANFLNSLEFSIQIFVQSRRLDIKPYLVLLEERLKDQTSELIKIQTREYVEFIRNFTESSEIMTKSFFVVVPYTPPAMKSASAGGFMDVLSLKQKSVGANAHIEEFEENQTQLAQRVGIAEQGLARVGIRTIRLGTEELVEFYYKIFNPGELGKPIIPQ